MKEPQVQIVIPVYNAEKYLRRCLSSVKSQTYSKWQAIIVDDASIDRSAEIIGEYCSTDSRFMCVKQNQNGGAAKARNAALPYLTSEYTAFLDADDYWESDMLSLMIERAITNASDIVQCRFIYDFPGGKQVLPKGAFSKDVSLYGSSLKQVYIKMMTGINMNHVCMKLIRTNLIQELQFNTSLKTAEDLAFCIKLFQKVKKYDFINKAFYHYCRHETSLTGNGLSLAEKFQANKRISKDLMDALPIWGIDNAFYKGLSYLRPYVITASKIYRTIYSKVFSK
jgi:glycosyltransferase involved in cell wall biosynthesis